MIRQETQEELLSADAGGDLLEAARRRLPRMSAANASTALHLLARRAPGSGRAADAGAADACGGLVRRVVADPGAQPRDLAIASWALVRLGAREEEPLAELARAVAGRAPELDAQDCANVAWAFAALRAGCSHAVLLDVAARAAELARTCEPRHLVGVAWALGSARVRHEDFFWAAASAARDSRAAHWVPQDVANFLWAVAVVRFRAYVYIYIYMYVYMYRSI